MKKKARKNVKKSKSKKRPTKKVGRKAAKKTAKNNVKKSKSKKNAPPSRSRNKTSNSSEKAGRKSPVKKRKKLLDRSPSKKTSRKPKTDRSRKSGTGVKPNVKDRQGKTKRISGRLITEKQTKKTIDELHFSFEGVRDISKKILLFESQARPAIQAQLRKHGGKPPRGIVVIVSGLNGGTKARVSPLDFVVNVNNVISFTVKLLRDMRDDFNELREMVESGEPDVDTGEGSSEIFNPNSVTTITIKFIYA